MRQIILDTETTGLNVAQGDKIIEIGCIEIIDRKITENHFHEYINPEREIPYEAYKIHGINDEQVKDKPIFKKLSQKFLDYIGDDEIIIHNAAFDMGFINAELAHIKKPPLTNKITDTLIMARKMWPGRKNSLDALCDRLSVDRTNRTLHGALMDAKLLALVYINMTREQKQLIEEEPKEKQKITKTSTQIKQIKTNITQYKLKTIKANQEEINAHQEIIEEINKSSGGKTIWAK